MSPIELDDADRCMIDAITDPKQKNAVERFLDGVRQRFSDMTSLTDLKKVDEEIGRTVEKRFSGEVRSIVEFVITGFRDKQEKLIGTQEKK